MSEIFLLLIGLIVGGAIIYLLGRNKSKQAGTLTSHSTVIEKIESVFKVVMVEGFFSEIHDFKQTEKFLYLIPITKKALLIINAKVMMGYDFKKLKLEVHQETNEVRILDFPAPEILSVDPELRYYDVEDNLLNKFSTADLTQIQQEAKKIVIEKALQSDMPQIAQNQARNLLLELGELKAWRLTGIDKILVPAPSKAETA